MVPSNSVTRPQGERGIRKASKAQIVCAAGGMKWPADVKNRLETIEGNVKDGLGGNKAYGTEA